MAYIFLNTCFFPSNTDIFVEVPPGFITKILIYASFDFYIFVFYMTVIVFYLTFIYPEPRSDLLVNKKDINLFYLICCTCKLISLAISTNLDIFLSISLFFILAVGPDILIAAIAFPFLSNIGAPIQNSPISYSSLSTEYPC